MEITDPLSMDSTKIDEIVNLYCDLDSNVMCRICLDREQPNQKMCNIFDTSKQMHYSAMIMSCSSVQVIEGDGLPPTICQKCIARLNVAWQFKIQCETSDAKFRNFYAAPQQIQVTADVDDFSQKHEQELFILKPNEINQNYSVGSVLTNSEQVKITITTPQPPLPPLAPDIENLNGRTTSDIPKSPTRKKPVEKAKEVKIHQCDTCGKTFNRREYLTQHIRIHTGEKPYHCHLCEKKFVNSGHLTTHMRTHTGVRPHACTRCPKAFSTRQELNKHTMVHNGERPFVCKMCGKRFGSSSNLYSHFKHHTGEKNFTCEHCGKAFYTKQELKQHLVVHTGEKAFLCEVCNKRFSQIAHLRRHIKLHKQQM